MSTRIGDAIKARRTASGMTSKDLARQTGLSEQYVGDVQHGYLIPQPETVLLIALVWPDQDAAAWLWLSFIDVYGEPVADLMRRHAVAEARLREGDGR